MGIAILAIMLVAMGGALVIALIVMLTLGLSAGFSAATAYAVGASMGAGASRGPSFRALPILLLPALLLGLVATGMYEAGTWRFFGLFTSGNDEFGSPWRWLAYAVFYNSLIFYLLLVTLVVFGFTIFGVLLLFAIVSVFVFVPSELIYISTVEWPWFLYFPPTPSQFHQHGWIALAEGFQLTWPFLGHDEVFLTSAFGWLYLLLVFATIWEAVWRGWGSEQTTILFKIAVSGTVFLMVWSAISTFASTS